MAEETFCVDCKVKVENPTHPAYLVKATGKTIIPLARCADCRAKYESLRVGVDKGLKIVSSLFLLALSLSGCAPYGPWPFSTEEQRRELLTTPGQTVAQVQTRNGAAHVDPCANPASPDSFKRLPDDFTGTAYFQLRRCMCSSDEAIAFEKGVAVRVWYVKAPWAGYETWQLNELVWDKQ